MCRIEDRAPAFRTVIREEQHRMEQSDNQRLRVEAKHCLSPHSMLVVGRTFRLIGCEGQTDHPQRGILSSPIQRFVDLAIPASGSKSVRSILVDYRSEVDRFEMGVAATGRSAMRCRRTGSADS